MNMLDMARARLLAPAGLDEAALARVLGTAARADTDLADLFLEETASRHWRLEDGRVTSGSYASARGAGLRAACGGEVAFAHAADPDMSRLTETAAAVRSFAPGAAAMPGGLSLAPADSAHDVYAARQVVDDGDAAAWIAVLERVERLARAADPRIVRVDAGLGGSDQTMLVADLGGGLAADVRPKIRLNVSVIAAAADGRRARGAATMGGRYGLDALDDSAVAAAVARACHIALINLDARPAPVGRLPVVLAPGYPGVLFHEAVGHGLEADHHRKNMSVFTGRIGERIAAPGVTVVDDGGVADRLGSIGIDDEGSPAQRTVLIEDGVLVGLMHDRLNAGLMNARSTGNGRRQSYAHLPMPRMTNTFLAAGTEAPEDILRSVRHGIYAVEFGGGQVDIVSGRFNFTTTEAYLIEDGRITAPLDGATLIGAGDETLRHVDRVGGDLALDTGEAVCGKNGQWVDVGVGQPTIRIADMMVGGRNG